MATIASVPGGATTSALVAPQVQVAAQGSHALHESPPSDSERQTQGTILTPPLNAPCPPVDKHSCARCHRTFKTSQGLAGHLKTKKVPCVPPVEKQSQSSPALLASQASADSGSHATSPAQSFDQQRPPANGLPAHLQNHQYYQQHPQHLLQPVATTPGNASPAPHDAPPVGFAAQTPGWTYAQLGSPMAVLHHHEPDDPATLSLFIAPEVGPFTITLQGKGKKIITKDSTQLSIQGDGSYYVTVVDPYRLQPSESSNIKSLLVQVHTARHGTIYQQKISYSLQAFEMQASAEVQDPPECDSEKEEESVSVCHGCYQQMVAKEVEDTMEKEESPTPVEDAPDEGFMICGDCFRQLCEFDQKPCEPEPCQPDEPTRRRKAASGGAEEASKGAKPRKRLTLPPPSRARGGKQGHWSTEDTESDSALIVTSENEDSDADYSGPMRRRRKSRYILSSPSTSSDEAPDATTSKTRQLRNQWRKSTSPFSVSPPPSPVHSPQPVSTRWRATGTRERLANSLFGASLRREEEELDVFGLAKRETNATKGYHRGTKRSVNLDHVPSLPEKSVKRRKAEESALRPKKTVMETFAQSLTKLREL